MRLCTKVTSPQAKHDGDKSRKKDPSPDWMIQKRVARLGECQERADNEPCDQEKQYPILCGLVQSHRPGSAVILAEILAENKRESSSVIPSLVTPQRLDGNGGVV
jgi:hypothetical protein